MPPKTSPDTTPDTATPPIGTPPAGGRWTWDGRQWQRLPEADEASASAAPPTFIDAQE